MPGAVLALGTITFSLPFTVNGECFHAVSRLQEVSRGNELIRAAESTIDGVGHWEIGQVLPCDLEPIGGTVVALALLLGYSAVLGTDINPLSNCSE